MSDSTSTMRPRRFSSDCMVSTRGAHELLEQAGLSIFDLTDRHHSGDWGDIDAEDAAANELALIEGTRLLSAYKFQAPGADGCGTFEAVVWLITEADRSATTALLPEEY